MNSHYLYVIIVVILFLIGSCSGSIPADVEVTDIKDVIPLPMDSLCSFIGMSKNNAMRKVVSYGCENIQNQNSTYDYEIQGSRSFDNYVLDHLNIGGDKKDINQVMYYIEFGTTETMIDPSAYSKAQEEATRSGRTIIPYDDVIKYVSSVGGDYALHSGRRVLFTEGVIKNQRNDELLKTTGYEEFFKEVNDKKPYSFRAIWQSTDYDLGETSVKGAKLVMSWSSAYCGPFSVSVVEN